MANKFFHQRDKCRVCGTKIPLLRHLTISCFNGAECPQCHSYMRFNASVCIVQLFIFILIFPALAYFEQDKLLGLFFLVAVIALSSLVSYFSSYKVDPTHVSRIKK